MGDTIDTKARFVGRFNTVHLRGHQLPTGATERHLTVRDPAHVPELVLAITNTEDSHYVALDVRGVPIIQRLDDNALLALKEHIEVYFAEKVMVEAAIMLATGLARAQG